MTPDTDDDRTYNTDLGAYARVTVTLEMQAKSGWGAKCDIEQIERQAVQDVLGEIDKANLSGAKVIGKPVVEAVLVRRRK